MLEIDFEKYIKRFYEITHIPRRYKCIMCNVYRLADRMYMTNGGIGICDDCYPEEFYTTKNKCFEAKGEIKFVAAPYIYTGKIRKVIEQYKFKGQRGYGRIFGQLMHRELVDFNFYEDYDMLVPVPLSSSRMEERGYNQAEILALELSREWNIPLRNDVLIRVRNTLRQSSLKGQDRVENVKDAFYADMLEVDGKNIILIDDIYTMGETAKACASALKIAGADNIIVVTLCKTMLDKKDT